MNFLVNTQGNYVSGLCFAHLRIGRSLPHLQAHFFTTRVLNIKLKSLSYFTGSNSSFLHSRKRVYSDLQMMASVSHSAPAPSTLPKCCQPPVSSPPVSDTAIEFWPSLFLFLFPSFSAFRFYLHSPFLPLLLFPFFLPPFVAFYKKKTHAIKTLSRNTITYMPPLFPTVPVEVLHSDLLRIRAALLLQKNRIWGPIYPRNHGEKFASASYFFPEYQYLLDSDLSFSLHYTSSDHKGAWESRHLLGSIQTTNFLI